MILHTVLILWAVALVAGELESVYRKRRARKTLDRIGAEKFVTHRLSKSRRREASTT